MDDNFSEHLSQDQRIKLIEARIQQFAAEAYQHFLNIQTAEALGAEDQVEKAKQSMAILQQAIEVHKQQLEKLKA